MRRNRWDSRDPSHARFFPSRARKEAVGDPSRPGAPGLTVPITSG